MKRHWLSISLGIVLCSVSTSGDAGGDGRISPLISAGQAVVAQASPEGRGKASNPPKGRVPSYMGQIGLSDQQRAKIYGIQHEYSGPIKELEAKLVELRKRQMDDILKVLTATQRERYQQRVESAKKRRSK